MLIWSVIPRRAPAPAPAHPPPPPPLSLTCALTHHSEIEAAIKELTTSSGSKLVKRAERSQHDRALLTVLTHEDETLAVQVCMFASLFGTAHIETI